MTEFVLESKDLIAATFTLTVYLYFHRPALLLWPHRLHHGAYELSRSSDKLSEFKSLAQQAGVAQFDEDAIVDALSDNADGVLIESS